MENWIGALWNYMLQLLGTFQESLREGLPGCRPTVVQILPSKKQSPENLSLSTGEAEI